MRLREPALPRVGDDRATGATFRSAFAGEADYIAGWVADGSGHHRGSGAAVQGFAGGDLEFGYAGVGDSRAAELFGAA